MRADREDKAPFLYLLLKLALDSGARQGELFALTWDDIDWQTGDLTITKTLSKACKGNGSFTVKQPKTDAGRRRVRLSPSTLSVLRAWKEYRDRNGPSSHLVFCTRIGSYLKPGDFRKSVWARVQERAGLSPRGFHNLRHTCATLLLLRGINVKYVSRRLGHASIQITLQTYAHVLPEMEDRAVQVLECLFGTGVSEAAVKLQ